MALYEILKTVRFDHCICKVDQFLSPWRLDLEKHHGPKLYYLEKGDCWLGADSLDHPLHISQGGFVLLPIVNNHWIGSHGYREKTQLNDKKIAYIQNVNSRLLSIELRFNIDFPHPLVEGLPPLIGINSSQSNWGQQLNVIARSLSRLVAENTENHDIVFDRLCEILFVQVIRDFQTLCGVPGHFMFALDDRRIYKALQLIHEKAQEPWTVEKIARHIGMSRSSFANRFEKLVGTPPKTYLTKWRMYRASELLKNSTLPISEVAYRVGYSYETGLNKAFKRYFGYSPRHYRLNQKCDFHTDYHHLLATPNK